MKRYEPRPGGEMVEDEEGQWVWLDDAKELLEEITRRGREWDSAEAVLAMAVARLSGLVEGHPTARHNFLQRIDALVAKEEEIEALKMAIEENNEIDAETMAALAVLCGDGTLTPCADSCPGHLKPEAVKRYTEALDRWNGMVAENEQLKDELARLKEAVKVVMPNIRFQEEAPNG